jgi:hypothetical protein
LLVHPAARSSSRRPTLKSIRKIDLTSLWLVAPDPFTRPMAYGDFFRTVLQRCVADG